jgi:ABC-type phosphate/phosphonate transport system ATPase subunit
MPLFSEMNNPSKPILLIEQTVAPMISLDPKQNRRSMEWLPGRQIEQGQEQAVVLKVHQCEI